MGKSTSGGQKVEKQQLHVHKAFAVGLAYVKRCKVADCNCAVSKPCFEIGGLAMRGHSVKWYDTAAGQRQCLCPCGASSPYQAGPVGWWAKVFQEISVQVASM